MNAEITVFFSCPNCALLYEVKQVRRDAEAVGQFNCAACQTPVSSWAGGIYDYHSWKPLPRRR